MRGYFGIGIYHPKHKCNQGTLWRSAFAFGASFIFTIGPRFRQQSSDTPNTHKHVPMLCFADLEDLIKHLPNGCPLIGVELHNEALSLCTFAHPERACYLLGAEDYGLPQKVVESCHSIVKIPDLKVCLNVAVAGSLVMFDRQKYRS